MAAGGEAKPIAKDLAAEIEETQVLIESLSQAEQRLAQQLKIAEEKKARITHQISQKERFRHNVVWELREEIDYLEKFPADKLRLPSSSSNLQRCTWDDEPVKRVTSKLHHGCCINTLAAERRMLKEIQLLASKREQLLSFEGDGNRDSDRDDIEQGKFLRPPRQYILKLARLIEVKPKGNLHMVALRAWVEQIKQVNSLMIRDCKNSTSSWEAYIALYKLSSLRKQLYLADDASRRTLLQCWGTLKDVNHVIRGARSDFHEVNKRHVKGHAELNRLENELQSNLDVIRSIKYKIEDVEHEKRIHLRKLDS